MKKGYVQVTDSYERILHWMLALSCLLLCVTGLGMMFQTFNFIGLLFGGLKSLKLVHNFTGLVFAVSLILVIRMWWKEAGVFVLPEDLDWCMRFRQKGWKILFVPDARISHALGACSESRRVFVEWHKHRGMVRFYRKFFRHQYPGALMRLVAVGVWLRFALVTIHISVRRVFAKLGFRRG